jgi:hypothetical protein
MPGGRVTAGRLKADNTWAKGKTDVTHEAILAVGQSLILRKQDVVFEFTGVKFRISVEEVIDE